MKSAGLLILVIVVAAFGGALYWLNSQNDVTSSSEGEVVGDTPGGRSSQVARPLDPLNPNAAEPDAVAAAKTGEAQPETEAVADVPSEEPEDEEWSSGSVVGRVDTPLGAPAAGAKVYLSPNLGNDLGAIFASFARGQKAPQGTLEGEVDSRGRYRITGLDPEKAYVLTADHPDFVRATLNDVSAQADEERELESLVLENGGSVRGQVVDATGTGVAGAEVSYAVSRGNMVFITAASKPLPPRSTETDKLGRYELRGVESGTHRITASKEGLLEGRSAPVTVEVGDRHDGVNITLDPGQVLAGRIVGPSGQTVAGEVTAYPRMDRGFRFDPDSPMASFPQPRTEKTNAVGEFEITALPDGNYDLVAKADGFASGRQENVTAGEGHVVIELAVPGALAGRVVDGASGEGVGSFKITIAPQRTGKRPMRTFGRSDKQRSESFEVTADGAFTIEDVDPGTYYLQIVSDRHASSVQGPFDVVAGNTTSGITCALEPGSQLRGRVTSSASGEPISGANVQLQKVEENNRDRVMMRSSGGGSGGFLAAVDVSGSPGSDVPSFRHATQDSVTTDDEGWFEFERLDPGEYRVEAKASGYCKHSERVLQVLPGQAQEDIEIALDRAGQVAAIALASDGSTKAGLRIELEGPLGGESQTQSENTDAEGGVTFEDVIPGDYRIRLAGKSQFSGFRFRMDDGTNTPKGEPVSVRAGETSPVELDWAGVRIVRGRVLERGNAVQSATVSLKTSANPFGFGSPTTKTDSNGEFAFEDVEPGAYEVTAAKPTMPVAASENIVVGDALETKVEIALSTSVITGRVTDEAGDPIVNARITIQPQKQQDPEGSTTTQSVVSYAFSSGDGNFIMSSSGSNQFVRTDADGRYRADNVPAGTYEVGVSSSEHISSDRGDVEVGVEAVVEGIDFELAAGGRLKITVVDSGTGDGVAFASIRLDALGNGEDPETTESRSSFTPGDGVFEYTGLAPGRYRVVVTHDEYVESTQETSLDEKRNADELTFRLLHK